VSATGLVKYDAMCIAIAECHRVDEAKGIRNQARALEVLAKQARNIEAERQAAGIRIRAERRWGQMYRQQEKHDGGRPTKNHSNNGRGFDEPETLKKLGVSYQQSSTWQKLAEASDKQFETALNSASSVTVPTTSGVLRNLGATVKDEPESDPKAAAALWIWGRVNQFVEKVRDLTPKQCADRCDDVMRGDLKQHLPRLRAWLAQLEERL
jgi:hypothetical protein